MCLGVPGRIVSVEGAVATVDFWGVQRQVRLDVVDEPVQAGDYILNHVGYAIRRIPSSEIEATLSLYEELLQHAEASDDLMAADVRGEIAAAEGTDDTRATEGTDDTRATEGADDTRATEGTDDTRATEGADDTRATEGTETETSQ